MRNTCWPKCTPTHTQKNATQKHKNIHSTETKTLRAFSCSQLILQSASPPLSKPHLFPKLVLLIMLLYNACSGETLRGISLRLVLTLAGCWPTYTQPFQAFYVGDHCPSFLQGVFFLDRVFFEPAAKWSLLTQLTLTLHWGVLNAELISCISLFKQQFIHMCCRSEANLMVLSIGKAFNKKAQLRRILP